MLLLLKHRAVMRVKLHLLVVSRCLRAVSVLLVQLTELVLLVVMQRKLQLLRLRVQRKIVAAAAVVRMAAIVLALKPVLHQ
jgi:hypothetical protein